MEPLKLGTMEMRFAELIWAHAPIGSGELVRLCEQQLAWKKSTTYTMLRRLCERGLFENRGGTVCTVLSREELLARQSEQFVQETFSGSLPGFVAAFASRRRLDTAEIEALQRLIDESREARG